MNEKLKLKVCGLTKIDQIQTLAEMDVDFLGFIFYPKSPRFALNKLTLEQIDSVKHEGKVGVFVDEKIEILIDIATKAGLNFIQLHGDENVGYIKELKKNLAGKTKIIKVFRIGEQVVKTIPFEVVVDYFLFDTDSASYGGTGKTFDWEVLNKMEIDKPYFISGGISEEVLTGLALLKKEPFALDINSKFETAPGNKEVAKICRFLKQLELSVEAPQDSADMINHKNNFNYQQKQ